MNQNTIKILLVVIIGITGFFATLDVFGANQIEVKMEEPFKIPVGITAELKTEQLFITLLNISDSRCPQDVTCIWEGEVIVTLKAIKDERIPKESILEIKTRQDSQIEFENYLIKLNTVEPYPMGKKEIQKSQYVVTLIVKGMPEVSPLEQFKSGKALDEIVCKNSMILLQKYNNKPVCVKLETVEKLIERGWKFVESVVNSFEECSASGNPVMESYPRQCRTSDGRHFVEDIRMETVSGELQCLRSGGKWLKEFNECEFISSEQCSEMNGVYQGCESACRHIPNAEICTAQCIPVCTVP